MEGGGVHLDGFSFGVDVGEGGARVKKVVNVFFKVLKVDVVRDRKLLRARAEIEAKRVLST
jgi:hypothetical protein